MGSRLPQRVGSGRRWVGTVAAMATLLMGFTGMVVRVSPAWADATFNQRMLELINQERAANNIAPVAANATLAAIGEGAPYNGCGFPVSGRAVDMGQRAYFSHTIAGCGQGVSQMLTASGLVYSGMGENIAYASALTDPLTAATNLHSVLMASPGHRANILNPAFTNVGIGSWHTAPGQTWSGGGYPLGNVYITAEIFTGELTAATGAGNVFHPVSPSRILDTRAGVGAPAAPLGAGATMNLQVTGRGGVPAVGVSAVVMNVTVTGPTAFSYLTVFPAGEALPLAANLNFVPGQTVPNLVTAKLGANGQASIYNAAGTTHIVADVAGWYGPS